MPGVSTAITGTSPRAAGQPVRQRRPAHPRRRQRGLGREVGVDPEAEHVLEQADGGRRDVEDEVERPGQRQREPLTLQIKVSKSGPVTAADIQADANITIINPEQVICTLDSKKTFEAEIEIKTGRGYYPGEANKKEEQAIGVIPIDSLFSPVRASPRTWARIS